MQLSFIILKILYFQKGNENNEVSTKTGTGVHKNIDPLKNSAFRF